MKKKLTRIVLAVVSLILVMSFAGCTLPQKNIYKGDCMNTTTEYKRVALGSNVNGYDGGNGYFYVMKNTDENNPKSVYNYEGTKLFDLNKDQTFAFNRSVIKVSKKDGNGNWLYSCYNSDGTAFYSGLKNAKNTEFNAGFFICGYDCYTVDKYTGIIDIASKKTLKSDFEVKVISDCDLYFNNCYYMLNDIHAITVYDKNFKCTAFINFGYDGDIDFFILPNGDIYFQNMLWVDESVEEYSFVMGGDKYQLKAYVFDVSSNELKEIKTEYYFSEVYSDGVEFNFADVGYKCKDAIAYGCKIEGKLLNMTDMRIYTVNSNGKVSGEIKKFVTNQEGVGYVATNRYMGYTVDGYMFVSTGKGKVLAQFGEIEYEGGLFVVEKLDGTLVLYDLDFNVVAEYDVEKDWNRSSYSSAGALVVSYEEGDDEKCDLYQKGAKVMTIKSEDLIDGNNYGFVIKTEKGKKLVGFDGTTIDEVTNEGDFISLYEHYYKKSVNSEITYNLMLPTNYTFLIAD